VGGVTDSAPTGVIEDSERLGGLLDPARGVAGPVRAEQCVELHL